MTHGYAGDPSSFPDAVTLLDDGDLFPAVAAILDIAPQNLADRTAYLNAQRGTLIAENWQDPLVPGLATNHTSECKPAFDSAHARWIFADNDGGANLAMRAVPGLPGTINAHLSTHTVAAGRATCVLKDPTDSNTYYLASILTSNSFGTVYRLDITTGLYTPIFSSGAVATDVQLACFNGKLIVAAAMGASSTISVSSNRGATFGSASGSTPIDCDTTFNFVQNATQLLLVGNHTIALNIPNAMLSSDGSTFTTEPFLAAFAGGDNGIGTAWGRDVSGNCFIFCYAPTASSGTTRKFLRSSDGITWTAVATTLTKTPILDLVAIANTFLGIMVDATDGTKLVYSVDGAASWRLTQFCTPIYLMPVATAAASCRLGAGANQFCALFLDAGTTTDTTIVFSDIAGTSGVATT